MQSQLLACAAGGQRVVLDAPLSPVQSRLLTCAAGVVDAPVPDRSSSTSTRSWGGVYVIAGFTECSRRLRNVHVVNSWRAPTTYDISRHRGPAVRLGWLAPARQLCDRDRSRCRALGGARSGSPQLTCDRDRSRCRALGGARSGSPQQCKAYALYLGTGGGDS